MQRRYQIVTNWNQYDDKDIEILEKVEKTKDGFVEFKFSNQLYAELFYTDLLDLKGLFKSHGIDFTIKTGGDGNRIVTLNKEQYSILQHLLGKRLKEYESLQTKGSLPVASSSPIDLEEKKSRSAISLLSPLSAALSLSQEESPSSLSASIVSLSDQSPLSPGLSPLESKETTITAELPQELKDEINRLPSKPWLDLPLLKDLEDGLSKINPPEASRELKELIINYHQLSKTDKRVLSERIQLLSRIHERAVELKAEENLIKASYGKMCYLKKLAQISQNPYWFLNFYFGGTTESGDLIRTLRFDEYGYEINLEIKDKKKEKVSAVAFLDPAFRAGFKGDDDLDSKNMELFSLLHTQWLIEYEANKNIGKDKTFPSFYMWLEDKDHITKKFTSNPQQAIEILELRKCIVNNGRIKLCHVDGNLNFEGDVVVTASGELFISAHNTWSHVPNHPNIASSFMPVIFAGKLTIKNGKIIEAHNFSGHFQPGPVHFEQFIQRFNSCFDPDCKLTIFYKRNGDIDAKETTLSEVSFSELKDIHTYPVNIRGKIIHMTKSEISAQLDKKLSQPTNKIEAATRFLQRRYRATHPAGLSKHKITKKKL